MSNSTASAESARLLFGPGFKPGRPFLAFFRAGPQSLHPRLLAEDPQRNWDACVSWWSAPPPAAQVDMQCFAGDNKYEGFMEFMQDADFLSRYRYVMLIDDDVYFRPGDISRMFEICDRHALYLSQPALNRSTNINHVVTARNPLCEVRRVSFVEVMTPCFSQRALAELAHTFDLTRSTCGIDLAWSSLLRDRDLIRVVDAVAVDHTKPVDPSGGVFYRRLRSMGVDVHAEVADIMRRYPDFGGPRTLHGGHVYRQGLPRAIAAPATRIADSMIKLRYSVPDRLRGWHNRLRRAPAATG